MNRNNYNEFHFASLQEAKGEIPYNMTNDYMFRAVLQSNNMVLCGLIRSLLHISEDTPLIAEITNPIVLGESITDKEFRLDINVTVNNSFLLNLEMQVTNNLNWQNRSISYLSRSFVQANRGGDYSEIRPAIHIGFLDYTLFREHPEFFMLLTRLLYTGNVPRGVLRSKIPRIASAKRNLLRLCASTVTGTRYE